MFSRKLWKIIVFTAVKDAVFFAEKIPENLHNIQEFCLASGKLPVGLAYTYENLNLLTANFRDNSESRNSVSDVGK